MYRISSLIFTVFFALTGFSDNSFVTCRISGQLANNMNQIATTLAYAWDYGAEPFFPELHKEEWNISYNQSRFFFRLNDGNPPRPIQNFYNEYENGGGWWDCNQVQFKTDQYLVGDFFCWKHFHHHRDRLVSLFAPSQTVLSYIEEKYDWLLRHPKTVSIHVRTYNKEYHDFVMRFIGLEFYEKSMNVFPEDTLFVVFSDRINWCKRHFSSFNKQIIFIEGNDHIEDFFLMSMLKSHIISNSCYSWWAAYLNDQSGKIVIAPERTGRLQNELDNNIYFPDWILIEPNLEEPYPVDMKDFDHRSTSVDTQ
jgi:hypothetical protein